MTDKTPYIDPKNLYPQMPYGLLAFVGVILLKLNASDVAWAVLITLAVIMFAGALVAAFGGERVDIFRDKV